MAGITCSQSLTDERVGCFQFFCSLIQIFALTHLLPTSQFHICLHVSLKGCRLPLLQNSSVCPVTVCPYSGLVSEATSDPLSL